MTRNSASRVDPYLDQARLHAIQVMLCTRLDELFNELGVRLYRSGKMYAGCCPVHCGDNSGALNLYRFGDTRPGYWECRTRHCEHDFAKTIIGFVRGVLSQQRCGWECLPDRAARQAQRKFGWRETIDWCCEFLGKPLTEIEIDYEELEKLQYSNGIGIITRQPKQEKTGLRRETVRKWLQIPARYFVQRGYLERTLDRYDVGFYPVAGRELSGRACVPVYDNDHEIAVGFTARSVHERCPSCSRWHAPGTCPQDDASTRRASKWWTTFDRDAYLYNYWFAKKEIHKTRTVVLCEGPGDVWRLEEAGIKVGLAMFGVKLSDQQQVILEMSGASNAVVLTDTDEAGDDARTMLKRRLGHFMRLTFPTLTRHDIGEMSVEQVRGEILPVVQKIQERGY